jgi:hypothetical protein
MQFIDNTVTDRQLHVVLDRADVMVAAEVVEESVQVGDQE